MSPYSGAFGAASRRPAQNFHFRALTDGRLRHTKHPLGHLFKALDASITAVDFLPGLLHGLDIAAQHGRFGERNSAVSGRL